MQQPVRLVARVAGFYICTHSRARECPHIGKPATYATYATDMSQRVPGPKGPWLRPTGEELNAAEASMARRGIKKLEMLHSITSRFPGISLRPRDFHAAFPSTFQKIQRIRGRHSKEI